VSRVDTASLIERLEPLLKQLPELERADASRVLELLRAPGEDDRRELNRLTELLGRRTARAVPFAVLGRARLAELASSPKDADSLRLDCSVRLDMIGY